MQDLEHIIRERAYHLWVEAGRKDGDADAHWLAAQREIPECVAVVVCTRDGNATAQCSEGKEIQIIQE